MYKLGIDVGGTNTDAVLIDEQDAVVAAVKRPTSDDIYTGIMDAVDAVLEASGADRALIGRAMRWRAWPCCAWARRPRWASRPWWTGPTTWPR